LGKGRAGPRAVDPTREYVDGGRAREPITERQRKAVLRLNRAERELGADGSALVHEVLILGMTMEQVGQSRIAHPALGRLFRAAAPRMSGPAGADLWICDGEKQPRYDDQHSELVIGRASLRLAALEVS
jgi:hypothetical protein